MNLKKYSFIRWVFFGIALISLLGITYMNIHYVEQVKEATKDNIIEKKREIIRGFGNQVRQRFINVPRALWKIDKEDYKSSIDQTGLPPEALNPLLEELSKDSLYSAIYFHSEETTPCESGTGTWLFNQKKKSFEWVRNFPDLVCDGISVGRTRMKVLLDDYRFVTKTTFDTHRSMNVTLIYPDEHRILGYLIVLINNDYLLDSYLKTEFNNVFKDDDKNFTIWVTDWARNITLLSNHPDQEIKGSNIQILERFPGLFDNWNILASIDSDGNQQEIESQTTKNLIIVTLSVALLLASLVFIIYSAQKEREISVRQSEFLSNVTHELKTPLAVIQAAGENIKDGRVKNEERLYTYGKHIYVEAVRLKSMIEKLLDVARFDSKQIKAQYKIVDINEEIEKIIGLEQPLLQSSGFELEQDLKASEAFIKVDLRHFETILTNLIDNAVKYSYGEKWVKISSETVGKELKISVQDKGSGIPKSSLPHIFEKFYRVEDTLTAQTKGHGLGLAIVKQMVEINGGKIFVESEYQKGSIFTISFPLISRDKIS